MINEADNRVQIPFKSGHYQFTFFPGKNEKQVRRIYKDDSESMYGVFDKGKADALRDYPEAHGFACHSPQCDD